MADEKTTKIFEIDVDYSKAIKQIAEYRESLGGLQAEEKRLQEAMREEGADREALGKQIAANKINQQQYSEAIRVLNKEVRNQIKAEKDNVGSLKALRAELSNATKEYDEMSRAEREGAKGQELRDHINKLTEEIKGAEYATTRYYRNVGNYPKEIISKFKETAIATGSLKKAFQAAGASAKDFGKMIMKVAVDPVYLAVIALAAALAGAVKAFNNSEKRALAFRETMAKMQPIINMVNNAFGYLADALLLVVKYFAWLYDTCVSIYAAFFNLIGIENNYRASVEESIDIERERQKVLMATRNMKVEEASAELEVAKLRDKVAQKDKYTTAERKKALEDAIKIEERISQKRIAIARANFANLEREAQLTENDAEMNERLADAKAKLLQAEKEFYDDTRRLQQQRASFEEEERQDEEERARKAEERRRKAAEEAKRRREQEARDAEERRKKEREAIKAAEDALTQLIADAYEKQVAQTKLKYNREIDALKERLKTEKNLTPVAIASISATITAKRQELNELLESMERNHSAEMQKIADEELERTIEANQERIRAIQDALQEERDAYARYVEEQQRLKDEEVAVQQAKLSAIEDVMGNLSDLFGKFGEDNKAFAKLSKVLALGEIAVNTGKAIAAGIAQAQSVPFPGNLAAIATTVATILANVTSAVSTVKSAKFAHGGKVEAYSTGGSVRGAGTGTSDSITARLSNGESVLTAMATSMASPILSAINQMGGGVPIQTAESNNQIQGEMMLARSFARALNAMPAPVVSVVDITERQNQVQVLQEMGTI